jgi:hypothetical protein
MNINQILFQRTQKSLENIGTFFLKLSSGFVIGKVNANISAENRPQYSDDDRDYDTTDVHLWNDELIAKYGAEYGVFINGPTPSSAAPSAGCGSNRCCEEREIGRENGRVAARG